MARPASAARRALVACALPLVAAACATALAPDDGTDPVDAGAKPLDASTSAKDTSSPPPADAGGAPDTSSPPADSGGGGGCSFSGVLATYDFTGELGSQASTKAKSSASGVAAGDISRAPALKAVTGANSLNSSQWGISATPSATQFVTFTLTVDPKCTLDLTSVTVDTKASALGPSVASIATSADKFGKQAKFTPGAGATPVAVAVSGASGALEVRIYGYAAVDPGGTMRVQNTLTVSGAMH